MKTKLFAICIAASILLFGCGTDKQEIPNLNSNPKNPSKSTISTEAEKNGPATFGFEKGTRSQCPPRSLSICCGRKVCLVTQLSRKFNEDYDMSENVLALDYMEAIMEVIDFNKIKITIPHNKIRQDVYDDWFINDKFEIDYYPFAQNVGEALGVTNGAFTEGSYPITNTSDGYIIIVNYETSPN